jgi:5-methylcytosine-specific restriction endonuclease McrA
MSELTTYLRDMSRARRASRALKAKYGPTRVYSIHDVERYLERPKRHEPSLDRAAMVREQRNRRFLRMQQEQAAMLEAQGFRCYLCGDPFTSDDPPSRDHVYPRSKKGGDLGNILLAHDECNHAKGDRAPDECEKVALRRVNAILYADNLRGVG